MPKGQHVSKRPSGSQQRKSKKIKNELSKKLSGSMIKYMKTRVEDAFTSDSSAQQIGSDATKDICEANLEMNREYDNHDTSIQVPDISMDDDSTVRNIDE